MSITLNGGTDVVKSRLLLPFLLLPFLVIGCSFSYIWAWEVRSKKLTTAICEHFVDAIVDDCHSKKKIPIGFVSSPSLLQFFSSNSPSGFGDLEVRVSDVISISSAINLEDGVDDYEEKLESQKARRKNKHCEDVLLSSFSLFIPSVKQEATYDSVARQIEACFESDTDKDRQVIKLCSGTRKQPVGICGRSTEFVREMQQFDRLGQGAVATIALTLVSISYGIFQFMCLFIALLGFYFSGNQLLRLSNKANKKKDFGVSLDASLSAFEAASIARARAESAEAPKGITVFTTIRNNFKGIVENKYKKWLEWGDTVVLIGLLGTLWGMISLFAALSESGSSEPLTAEPAKSKMLGSLGLAFGTTLFAGLVRLVYINFIPGRSDKALEFIDEAFVSELSATKVSKEEDEIDIFESPSVAKYGQKMIENIRLKDGSDHFFASSGKSGLVIQFVFFFVLVFCVVAYLSYLSVLKVSIG